MALFTFLAARSHSSSSQTAPHVLESRRALRILAHGAPKVFPVMILLLLDSGPLDIRSIGRWIEGFGGFAMPAPFPGQAGGLHEAPNSSTTRGAESFGDRPGWNASAHVVAESRGPSVDRNRPPRT